MRSGGTGPWRVVRLAVVLALGGAAGRAQTPCFTNVGPDVIVGDITGTANYAPSGGVEAFATGISLCNIGTVWLNHAANTNQHPVVGSGLYRLKHVGGANRFEQVGVSWLTHGFFALSETACCACTPTDGTHLGVGCSDPSTANRQGTQGGLGPRWQVDAYTGAFPYPPASPPWSGSVARRLQVRVEDLEVTGVPGAARYFVERHVIAPDDAAAGNAHDNASWREVLVSESAGNWSFTLTGAVQRESSAIGAWAALDPGVQQVVAQVPGEGRFLLAHAVTELGGGVWHYEYALQNVDSHVAAHVFSVPVHAGVQPAAVGFHDVAHHDGDGIGNVDQSGADWSAFVAGGALTWAGESFAQNANGNALRWGTLYAFRFDADVPPAGGTVTIGLFRTPGDVAVGARVPAPLVGAAYCSGDGSGAACPCANHGASGAGCVSSLGSGGRLTAAGTASIAADTVVLLGRQMPDAPALYFQGTARTGTAFGDGKRCAGGTVIRLATRASSGGASRYPDAGDPPVSVRGLVTSPGTRDYQVWYRNAAAFCTPATFNLTNGWEIVWTN